MKLPLLLLLVPLVAACEATLPPTSHSHTLFPTALSAVIAATNRYNPISIREDREFMGTVYRHGARYGYTVSSGRPGTGASDLLITRERLTDVVAFWHTHGRNEPAFAYFSATDTEVVARFGLPMYLADHTGRLKVFRPGDSTLSPLAAHLHHLPREPGFAQGVPVKDPAGEPVLISTRRVTITAAALPAGKTKTVGFPAGPVRSGAD